MSLRYLEKFQKSSWYTNDKTRAPGMYNFSPKLAEKYLLPNMNFFLNLGSFTIIRPQQPAKFKKNILKTDP